MTKDELAAIRARDSAFFRGELNNDLPTAPMTDRRALLAEVERLTRERDEALRDAERYRWLRDGYVQTRIQVVELEKLPLHGRVLFWQELDAAIDAARDGA